MKYGIVIVVILIVTGCATQTKSVAIDPNDTIYKFMLQPPEAWVKEHGMNDKSVTYYNLSVARGHAAIALNEMKVLKARVDSIHDPNTTFTDPNEVK